MIEARTNRKTVKYMVIVDVRVYRANEIFNYRFLVFGLANRSQILTYPPGNSGMK